MKYIDYDLLVIYFKLYESNSFIKASQSIEKNLDDSLRPMGRAGRRLIKG